MSSSLNSGPTTINAYLRFDGVRVNTQYPSMTVEVFLSPAEMFLIEKGIVTTDEMAKAYHDRIDAGIFRYYKVIQPGK